MRGGIKPIEKVASRARFRVHLACDSTIQRFFCPLSLAHQRLLTTLSPTYIPPRPCEAENKRDAYDHCGQGGAVPPFGAGVQYVHNHLTFALALGLGLLERAEVAVFVSRRTGDTIQKTLRCTSGKRGAGRCRAQARAVDSREEGSWRTGARPRLSVARW